MVEVADGNDFDASCARPSTRRDATKGKPRPVIIATTVKGKGVSFMEDQVGWHGKAPNDEQFAQAMAELEEGGCKRWRTLRRSPPVTSYGEELVDPWRRAR